MRYNNIGSPTKQTLQSTAWLGVTCHSCQQLIIYIIQERVPDYFVNMQL